MKGRAGIIVRFVVLLLFIAAGFITAMVVASSAEMQEFVVTYGYPGLFLMSVVSGFNLAVPLPIATFIPVFVVSGLGLWPCIMIMTVGMTLADTVAFFLGRVGRQVLHGDERKMVKRLERIRSRNEWAPVVIMFVWACIAPLPNEVLAIPLGYMGFRTRYILPAMACGNLIFNSLMAFGILSLYFAV